MKKFAKSIVGLLSVCVFASAVSTAAFAANDVNVVVGEKLQFEEGSGPIIYEEHTMMPLRAVSEALDATVYWFADKSSVQIVQYDTLLSLQIGNNIMGKYKIVNGEPSGEPESIKLTVAPIIHNERTYVPLRAISEAFDASISWDNPNRSAIIIPSKKTENFLSVKEMSVAPENTLCSVYGVVCYDSASQKYFLRSLTKNDMGAYSQITFCTPKVTSIADDTDYNDYVKAYWTEQFGMENPSGMVVKFSGVTASLNDTTHAILNKTTTTIKPLGRYDEYMKSLGLDFEPFSLTM